MAQVKDEASFTFSWLALKLLGRGLYSNPWSALSELVANGLDAGAQNIYVYVDASEKANAMIEVIDDGSGMSRNDISTYVKVGYDRRKQAQLLGIEDGKPKGRKGIGKLAALFLSQHFFLETRHREGETSWELDAREGNVSDTENPSLHATESLPSTHNDALWGNLISGTRLVMLGVDLTGYGSEAMSALGSRLANQFLLPENATPRILLLVRTASTVADPDYVPVKKGIAFRNFAELAKDFTVASVQPTELAEAPKPVSIPAKGLPGDVYLHTPTWTPFVPDPQEDEAWAEIENDVDLSSRAYRGVRFSLSGWIGLHATIETETARKNDTRFTKNKYYNPAQIRVYVRGKLASDRLLSQLGITGTYANYIEGEITFDLLDDDALPDIATSNRQDFDETDKRVTLLRALVRPIVRSLIQRRNTLASKISSEIAEEKARRDSAGKRHFAEQLQGDLDQHQEISQPVRDELLMVITNKIQGDVAPKQTYRVFISHAREDRFFASFIDDVLCARGANTQEIFFTSRGGSIDVVLDERSLSEIIKKNITDDNTLIFYLTSRHFLRSQFCLFEGGAGWATRAVSEYLKLNVDYDSIPTFLTNGKGEAILLSDSNEISLTPEVHNYVVEGILNPMIAHLNRGREIAGEPRIEPFQRQIVPSAVELNRLGKTPEDYYEPSVKEHWQVLIDGEITGYLAKYQ